jgi:broad specificity phosphatase PhoE
MTERMLYVIRHGQTQWPVSPLSRIPLLRSLSGANLGQIDTTTTHLSDHGKHQATEAGKLLQSENIHSVYSSDLARAQQSASIIAESLGLHTYTASSVFREMGFGKYEGMAIGRILLNTIFDGFTALRVQQDWSIPTPSGESFNAAISRVCDGIGLINQDIGETEGNTALVTHGFITKVIPYIYSRGTGKHHEEAKAQMHTQSHGSIMAYSLPVLAEGAEVLLDSIHRP